MIIAFDTHTHTIMSGHAYSTLEENISACVRTGMEGFVITDHGPSMEGAAKEIYFYNLPILPREIDGIRLLRGAETNIIDYQGHFDLPEHILSRLDVCIASFHAVCLAPQTAAKHTAAWLAAIRNPYIDIIGHPGRGPFPFDLDAVVAACRQYDKLIEINSHTLDLDGCQYVASCKQIAEACRAQQVKIVVNSDAHLSRKNWPSAKSN